MRILLMALAATTALTSLAYAGDKPIIGPAPTWVKPVQPAATSAKGDEAPMRILLSDQQIALEPGKQTLYTDIVLKIQTPQGLSAGNISFPWRPDTDELTVHKLLIRRGDQVIDVLASGQTFTVARRETNLESATLDGVLTANIQPEGLQVGDIIEFAASLTTSDPTLKGHVEQIAGTWNGYAAGRAHLRMQWPSTLKVKLQQNGALPALKPIKTGGTTQVELMLDNIDQVAVPRLAPARYGIGRRVEVTDFASWADLGALMAPLYQKAATLPAQGPLLAEVDRIRTASSDPKTRAQAALALVQDRVRYVALQMGTGGLVPADAETTWSRRFGDCKGKTALLLAILHALDIQAEPVVVSTVGGDGMDARLPMVGLFDHVLVRATLAGKVYWLDGTRSGDVSLDRLKVPDFGWGLPLVPTGAALVRIVPPPLDVPLQTTTIRMDATSGISIPAPTKVETVFRGDQAFATNLALTNLTGEARDRALREYWRSEYEFIDALAVNATFDPVAGELRMTMEGKARMDWSNGYYETDGTGVGYKADFRRDPGPDQDAPFAVSYPYFIKTVETIQLPHGFSYKPDPKAEVSQTVAGIEYRRHASIAGDAVTIEKTERSVASEFPFKDAVAAGEALRDLADRRVYIPTPRNYRQTDAELAVAATKTPTTATGFISRGLMYLDRRQLPLAIKDFDSALALDPKNVWALADRGIARVWAMDTEAANRDLDAAFAIDPKNPVIFRARGLIAQQNLKWQDAIAAYSGALELDADDNFSLGQRAQAYRAVGNSDAALRDSAAALGRNPQWLDLYLMRANLFRSQGKMEAVAGEAAAVSTANPENAYAHVIAANIYSALGNSVEAMREYDRAIALHPARRSGVECTDHRPRSAGAGRRAVVDAALKLQPDMPDALAAKAEVQEDAGDRAGAIAIYTKAIAVTADNAFLLNARGILHARNGDMTNAEKDFAVARGKVSDAPPLNNMCWAKATAGVALESALADCNAALSKMPDLPSYLDSRGLVLLRMGRFDDAIADYSKALAKNPTLPSSLYGRAVAWARKGDKAKSDADAAAAIKVNANVKAEFERYGVRP